MTCVCLSVSVSLSVWEGGDSWLREVTGKHGSSFLPFSGPGVWSVKCGVWNVKCKVQSVECRV